jgi:uncharacterized protein (DUF1697 family)
MPRYVAFLRGVSPLNAKMPDLKRCFEEAGFSNVKTVLSSGNLVFDARTSKEAALERRAEAAMDAGLSRSFYTIVRPIERLQRILKADPFAVSELPRGAKRVVTFLRESPSRGIKMPIESQGVRILCVNDREVFTAYVPGARGPAFMALIEKTFGAGVTTRTWQTVEKCAHA